MVVVVETATKPSPFFAHFCQGAQSLAPAMRNASERPKVVRDHQFLTLLTSKCVSRHNGVHFFGISTSKSAPKLVCFARFDLEMRHNGMHFFNIATSKSGPSTVYFARFDFEISHLARWLCTRRFSEPTFRPSGATNHWNHTVNRDFSTGSHACIFFLLTLSLLRSSFFCCSLRWLLPPLLFHLSILSEV